MYLVIVSAIILAVLININHTLITAIKRSIEHSFLRKCTTFYVYLRHHLIPLFIGRIFNSFKIPTGNFFLKILFSLFYADIRYGIFKADIFGYFNH